MMSIIAYNSIAMGNASSTPSREDEALAPALPVDDTWIYHIFPALSGRDALRMRQVSKKWNAAIPSLVHTICFTGSGSQLRSLCYTCPQLRHVKLCCDSLVLSEINALSTLSQLTELDLGRGGVFMQSDALVNLTALRTLDLGHNANVMDAGIIRLTNLTVLNIGRNENITGWALNKLPLLVTLNLASNVAFQDIRQLTALTHLSGFFLNSRTVTDQVIRTLTRLTTLGRLNGPCVSDAGLSHLPHLRQLYLVNNDRVTDYALLDLTALTDLTLDHCESITDLSIQCLTNLTSLSVMHNNNISNDSISRLVRLETLTIRENTRVTDAGLVYLPALRDVDADPIRCNISMDFAISVYMRHLD